MAKDQLVPLGYAPVFKNGKGGLVVDTDSLRRGVTPKRDRADGDFDDFGEDDDDFDGEDDDDFDGEDDDFDGEEDDDSEDDGDEDSDDDNTDDEEDFEMSDDFGRRKPVSYTHLTLPTNREV